jgi:serine/threonine protein kinase
MISTENITLHDEYLFLKSLNRNDNNEIFLATRISDGRNVIIKQSDLLNEDVARISKLGHEFEILKELNYPGIPKVYDFLFDGKTAALVQEYIEWSKPEKLSFQK